jgi:lipid-A-disaccharide synthase
VAALQKYYVIAGEASGDLHGSNLLRALGEQSSCQVRFWGGDLMAAAVGSPPIMHYCDLAFMGFVEVVKNLRTILGFFKVAKRDIKAYKPDRVILIDYPGFNLRLAKWLYKQEIPVTYYITPQVWAWHASRVVQIQRYCDQRLVILPFEQQWFAHRGVEVDYVGHPLIDAIDRYPYGGLPQLDTDKPIIALLPGSRRQEIQALLPIMLEACAGLSDYQVVISKAPSQPASLYEPYLTEGVATIGEGKTYDLLARASCALVASGTATLETALHKVPQVVCYKGSEINYQIGRRLIDLDHISLVNLILGDAVVPELIQHDCTSDKVRENLHHLLNSPCHQQKMRSQYDRLWEMLDRSASDTAASLIIERYIV